MSIAEPRHETLAAYCLAWAEDQLAANATALTANPRLDFDRMCSFTSRIETTKGHDHEFKRLDENNK